MKFFAYAALIATVSAVRLSSTTKQGAPSWEDVLEVLDADGNGRVSWPEIEGFIAEMEQQYGEKRPAARSRECPDRKSVKKKSKLDKVTEMAK